MNKQEEFFQSIEENNINNVKLLLKDERVDPSNKDNYAILLASKNGYYNIVKLLLKDKRVDPSDLNNLAIQYASQNRHFEVVDFLWNDKRIKNSLMNNDFDLYNNLKIKNCVEGF